MRMKIEADLFDSESDVRSRDDYKRSFDTVRAFVNTCVAVDNAVSAATVVVVLLLMQLQLLQLLLLLMLGPTASSGY